MPDFNVRSDAVDVEQIMRQIRARIREKRGVDYTEEEIRELANVKLEKFLDPRKVRSDLLEHYRRTRQSAPAPRVAPPENYGFEDDTIYVSSRSASGRLIGAIRRLLNPILKLFFNPNPVIHVLNLQSRINTWTAEEFDRLTRIREELDALNYEVLNNLVVEMTRVGIDVKNVKMRVESISSRLDFDERRARALEGVVQYRTGGTVPAEKPATPPGAPPMADAGGEQRRRRRRRRGRRHGREGGLEGPGPAASAAPGATSASPAGAQSEAAAAPPPSPPQDGDSGPSEQ
jgi:hypothetical protein